MKNKQGNIAVIAIIVVIVAITAGVAGWMFAKKSQAPAPQIAVTQSTAPVAKTQPVAKPATPATNLSATTSDEENSLSVCGITVTLKNKLPVKTTSGNSEGKIWNQMTIGGDMQNSRLEIDCTAKNKNPQTDLDKLNNDASYVLGVQSDGANKVDKALYNVFDGITISKISNLYSAMNRGYRTGSETIGFSNEDWVYTFSFMNPKENKSQDTFAISVK